MQSLPPEEEGDTSHETTPLSQQPDPDELPSRHLVANGNGGVAITTVCEKAVEERAVVMEMSQFTSVMSPPADHLMLAKQVRVLSSVLVACPNDCVLQ